MVRKQTLFALLPATAPVFERLIPVETRTGVVRLYTVETPLLELPTLEETKPTDPGPITPAFDAAAWVTEVAHKRDEAASLDGSVLESVAVDSDLGRFQGFLLLACRDDGTAWYGLPPTCARSRILDPVPVCAAIQAKLM
jgi:hypothetical protein